MVARAVEDGELVVGEAVALDLRVARLASRGCALLLDLLLQFMALNFAIALVGLVGTVADTAWVVGLSILVTALVLVGYPCAFETLSRGRTLGKLAVGLRVVADDGGPVRFRQALVRALAGVIEFWTFYGAPALLASLFSRRGKRLGDLFAGTLVIQERVSAAGMFGPVAWMPPFLAGWARTLELSRLPDELAMTARQYLARFWELLPEVRDSLGERITGEVFAVVGPPPPPGVRPEVLLSAVLAERRHREERRLARQREQRLRRAARDPLAPPPVPVGGPPHGPTPMPDWPGAPAAHPQAGGWPTGAVAPMGAAGRYPVGAPGVPSGPYPNPAGPYSNPAGSYPHPSGPYPVAPAPVLPQTGHYPRV
ncbi:RDD family protein [Actinomadura logoneensis]|uniref:RDD family protein n=1 Tax=Actinomadura logoneensis TaxID=2293572 RepID=A0A372JNZ3_9ACTN|nr:RDD family protein [Actinomadura logoneensis]RFU41516.1 RDD family protein [Actinomadura logoneensis]